MVSNSLNSIVFPNSVGIIMKRYSSSSSISSSSSFSIFSSAFSSAFSSSSGVSVGVSGSGSVSAVYGSVGYSPVGYESVAYGSSVGYGSGVVSSVLFYYPLSTLLSIDKIL